MDQIAARQPCAGWVAVTEARDELQVGRLRARVTHVVTSRWDVTAIDGEARVTLAGGDYAESRDTARLAAEDALLAVADEIRRAVGR